MKEKRICASLTGHRDGLGQHLEKGKKKKSTFTPCFVSPLSSSCHEMVRKLSLSLHCLLVCQAFKPGDKKKKKNTAVYESAMCQYVSGQDSLFMLG